MDNTLEARVKALEEALLEKTKEVESLKSKLKGDKGKKVEKEKTLESPKVVEEEKKEKGNEIEERRKSQQSLFLKNFLMKAPKAEEPSRLSSGGKEDFSGLWKPFQLQPYQTMAEIVPTYSISRFNGNEFELAISRQQVGKSHLYLSELKNNLHKPYSNCKRTRRAVEDQDDKPSSDLIIVENVPKPFFKAIFLSFHLDSRPPYYGTWRKKSKYVTPRRPLAKDGEYLNYEIDSDEEWEDEDGESIVSSGSGGSIKNDADDFEVDDFLVPHGHLSGDEEMAEDDECPRHVTLVKEEDLLKQRSKKLEKLNPVVMGPFWSGQSNSDLHFLKALEPYGYVFNE